jgi:hypothetical protein
MYTTVEHFSYFDPDYPTAGLTVTGLARLHCITDIAYNMDIIYDILETVSFINPW